MDGITNQPNPVQGGQVHEEVGQTTAQQTIQPLNVTPHIQQNMTTNPSSLKGRVSVDLSGRTAESAQKTGSQQRKENLKKLASLQSFGLTDTCIRDVMERLLSGILAGSFTDDEEIKFVTRSALR